MERDKTQIAAFWASFFCEMIKCASDAAKFSHKPQMGLKTAFAGLGVWCK